MPAGSCCMKVGCMSMIDMGIGAEVRAAGEGKAVAPDTPLPSFESPIVPKGTIAGRALVAVIAIMTFLASVTIGAVMMLRAAAGDWQADLAREVTIQIRPVAGHDIEAGRGYLLVATGRAEVMLDPIMSVWDAAALQPILQEAGGTFTDWQGNPTIHAGEGLATNGLVLDEVLGVGDAFSRPLRAVLTLVTVLIGVATVVVAIGLPRSFELINNSETGAGNYQVDCACSQAPPPGRDRRGRAGWGRWPGNGVVKRQSKGR